MHLFQAEEELFPKRYEVASDNKLSLSQQFLQQQQQQQQYSQQQHHESFDGIKVEEKLVNSILHDMFTVDETNNDWFSDMSANNDGNKVSVKEEKSEEGEAGHQSLLRQALISRHTVS